MKSRRPRLPLALTALVLCAPALLARGGDPAGDPAGDPVIVDPAATNGGKRWGSEYFPNVPLITQDGDEVHFFDDLIRDRVVVINFIYTSCPDACPLETAKLSQVYGILGDRVGKDVFMYSVSIDPERDTPEVLKEYAERYQVGPGWTFLTGKTADIKLLRQKLGMIRTGEEALSDHSLNLLIGNQATGMWMKRSPMENPYLLATQIGSWLSGWKEPPKPGHDYKDAPKLRSLSRGEDLFRTRCATCHTFGAEDGILRQGPNLTGVTERRERAWLERWLAEPDVMLAEKDPIALELFAANRNLPMPNMRLNRIEVEALYEFMDSENRRVLAELQAAADWAVTDTLADTADQPEAEETRAPCCQKRDELVFESDPSDPSEASAAATSTVLEAPPAPAPARPAPRASQPAGGVPMAFAASAVLCLGLAMALGILSFVVRRPDAE